MATSDRQISKPIVNILTKAQYQGISSPSADEFYLITDDAAVSAGTGISVNSAGGETIVSLDSSYGLTASDITTGTDTTNKLVSAKTIADVLGTAGSITDVQVDSTSVVSGGVANIKTSTAHPYNASSNLLATMGDIAAAGGGTVTSVGLTNASGESDFTITGSPVTGSGTFTIKHSNTIQAGTAGTSSATSGSTLSVPYVTYDKHGHITAAGTHTHTISGFATEDTKVTNTLATTTKYYVTGTTSSSTNTGTQYFDSGIYATTTAGQLNATTYKVNNIVTLQYNSTDASLDFIF